MLASRVVILLILLIIPFTVSQSCKNANQANCGVSGTTCQYYTWFNGTQCVFDACTGQTTYSSTIQNCVNCQGATTSALCSACTTLASKYFFDTPNSICTTCSIKYGPLCSTCNSSQCVSCTDSNQLTEDKQSCFNGACGKQNCEVCLDTTSCKTCSGVFKLYEGNCVCGIENCQICSKESCTKCYEGFSLSSNKLACNRQCMSNCEKCLDLNSCESCVLGYKYNAPTTSCIIDCSGIANCNTCSTSTSCSGCTSGYQLSIKGTCEAGCTDTNCAQCLTFNQCDICKTGYRLQVTTCVRDVCSVQYCVKCLTGTQCKECQSFFQLSSNARTCLPSCGVSKCTVCDSASTCAACEDGFKVVNGNCEPICTISSCGTCRSQTVCKICNGGTILADSGTSCIFNCGITGCVNCDSSSTCSSCYPGYTLNALKTSCVVNCVQGTYLAANGCADCPTSNCRRCDATGKCLRCKSLFYLDSDTFTCVACSTISNCHDCEPGKASCTQCKNNFENVNGACVSQANCAVTNCKICVSGDNNKCSNCEDGYSINDAGGCAKPTCPGKQFFVGAVCSCGPKTYISGSNCENCADLNCLTCTASICTSCLSRYYPNGNACTHCTDNCARCDSSGCLECSTGFIIKNKQCISPPTSSGSVSVAQTGQTIVCSPGCGQCDVDSKNNNVCLSASTGFALVDGIIHKCDDNCKTCSEVPDSNGAYSICLSCHSGSSLIDGGCFKCTGLHATRCRKRNQAYSKACIPRYTSTDGTCKACGPNCISCDGRGEGNCDNGGCMTGFFNSEQFPTCNKCFAGCLVCGSNPRQCQKCGDYNFVNSQGTCSRCISNCLSCSTATTCNTCVSGYLKVTSGVCKIPSVANCVQYDGELNCLTCDLNYNLVGGKCTASIACNTDSTCTTCPYNFFLNSGKCNNCPSLPNCRSCSVSSSSACMDCNNGYYLSKGACVRCSLTGCASCSSIQVCTTASEGFYLVSDSNGALTGGTGACQGLCSTCTVTSLNCLSCKDGAYIVGNQCMSKNNVAAQFTGYMKELGPSSGETSDYQIGLYINSLFTILDQMRVALGYKDFHEFLLNVLVQSVGSGSIKMSLIQNSDSTKKNPTVLGTYPFSAVVPLKVTSVVNTDTTTTTTNSVNIPLVLGVSIPLAILLIVIIVVIKVRGSGDDDESGFDGTEKYFDENQDHF